MKECLCVCVCVCVCVCGIWEKLFLKFFEKYQYLIKKHLDEIVLAFQKKIKKH